MRVSTSALGIALAACGLPAIENACAADPEGFVLGAACLACHASGDAQLPAIIGRDARTLRELLAAFRDGSRPGTVMPRLARGYDDEQVARIAAWLAAQRPRP